MKKTKKVKNPNVNHLTKIPICLRKKCIYMKYEKYGFKEAKPEEVICSRCIYGAFLNLKKLLEKYKKL